MIDLKKEGIPRVAVIGCGAWGRNLIRNFSELGALAAVCDEDGARAVALASQFGVSALSEDQIIHDPAIDAVVFATHAPAHAPQAERALKAGKHVYLEKPMVLSVADAENLCALAKAQERILMVGHILHYHPAFIALKEHLPALGPLKHIYANRLGLGRFRHHENVFWDLSSHDISLILSLTKERPLSVEAQGQAYIATDKPASALMTLTFSNHLTAHLHASWLSPFKEQKFVVIGDYGIAVFDDCKPWAEKLHISTQCLTWKGDLPHANDDFQTRAIVLDAGEPLKNECLHFLACIENGETPLTSGEEGLGVTDVLERAEKALCLRRAS